MLSIQTDDYCLSDFFQSKAVKFYVENLSDFNWKQNEKKKRVDLSLFQKADRV